MTNEVAVTPWETICQCLIVRPDDGRVLLAREGAGWGLPRATLPGRDLRKVGAVRGVLRRRWRLETCVLRVLAVTRREDARRVGAIVALEAPETGWRAPGEVRWAAGTEVVALFAGAIEQREAVARQLAAWATGEEPPDAPTWARVGWTAGAVAWADETLAARGLGPVAGVEQVRLWDLSCVLRLAVPGGAVYLKAVASEYAPEVRLTAALAARHPTDVPPVLATDHARGWLLLGDVGEPMDDGDVGLWERATDRLARLQRASAARGAGWLTDGALDQRPAALAAQTAHLLAAAEVRAALDADEYARLCALAPRLAERGERLATYGLPPTLVHGDLHTGNIAVRGGAMAFFDWGDGALAHPFFDLIPLLDARYFPPGIPDAGERLRGRYFAAWADYAPLSGLHEAFALATPLAELRYAIGCLRCFPSLGAVWLAELRPTLRGCLLSLLAAGEVIPTAGG